MAIHSAYDFHVHWEKRSERFWQLRLAEVRLLPAHWAGVIRLSAAGLYLRVSGTGWFETWNPPGYQSALVLKGVTRLEAEDCFRAYVASRALQGNAVDRFPNNMRQLCPTCPEVVRERQRTQRKA